jgi:hypothetical protein
MHDGLIAVARQSVELPVSQPPVIDPVTTTDVDDVVLA